MAARARRRQSYDPAVAAVPVTIPYSRYSIQTAHWWIARAIRAVLDKSGFTLGDIDGLCLSSFSLGSDTAVGVTQHLGLSVRWLDHIPMGGASGVVALRRAARAVQSGDASIVICVAGDTNATDLFRNTLSGFSRFAQDASNPYGYGGPNANFALLTDYFMRTFGLEREDFGKLCVAQRQNSLVFPYALMKGPLTLDDYLAARPIAEPLGLYDCVMPCAGAEAFLVLADDTAEAAGLPYANILATIENHDAYPDDPIQFRGGWAVDCEELYAMAGIGPSDVDFVESYDDYPVICAMQFEDLGFCAKGDAADFIRRHSFTTDGDFPHNTSGGQLSVGQAGAAGGLLGMVEALRQLTGQALGSAVPDAKIGLVSGFGMINFDRGLCSGAAILARRAL